MVRIRHQKVKEVGVQRNLSPGRRVACNSPSEGTRFRQSRQSRPEHPGVSDGNYGRCWCEPAAEPDSSILLNAKLVEPVIFYPGI